jgi:hypothetical protein
MAQNVFINANADKSASKTPDNLHYHTVSGGAAASGDFTISYDSTVVTTLAMFDTLVRQVRLRLQGGGLK